MIIDSFSSLWRNKNGRESSRLPRHMKIGIMRSKAKQQCSWKLENSKILWSCDKISHPKPKKAFINYFEHSGSLISFKKKMRNSTYPFQEHPDWKILQNDLCEIERANEPYSHNYLPISHLEVVDWNSNIFFVLRSCQLWRCLWRLFLKYSSLRYIKENGCRATPYLILQRMCETSWWRGKNMESLYWGQIKMQ